MKIALFLSSLWLCLAGSALLTPNNATLRGTVKDEDSNEPLIGATVRLMKDKKDIAGAMCDMDGNYKITAAPGTYEVEASFTGYGTVRFADIVLTANNTLTLDFALKQSGGELAEVVVVSGSVKKRSDERTRTLSAEPAAVKSAEVLSAKPLGKSDKKSKPKPAPKTAVPEAAPAKTSDERPHKDAEFEFVHDLKPPAEGAAEEGPGTIPGPRAGLLTAGEWNDLHNWNHHWADLLADGEISQYQNMYRCYPAQRYTLLLHNPEGFPVVDAYLKLSTDKGEMLWETRSDNTGKAELWAGFFDQKAYKKVEAEAWVNGKRYELGSPKPAKEGINIHEIKVSCDAPNNVDIVWAVDATGSMGDEIEYLKVELLDVINRAKRNNPSLDFSMGTVFYRDKGDEYVTKSSQLSGNISKTVDFIRKQSAGGGGDYPEAVHSALEEAIFAQKWRDNAVARICFLVLDASPHQDPAVVESLQRSIREAARRGIRIVPLAASGIQKDTEFLLKFFGLATNGTYLFLTDHSGIGGKHLEPTSDEYKVEPLNELLVRIITEYTTVQTCEGKSRIQFEEDPQQTQTPLEPALYYPNPAVKQFTLELPVEVQSVTLYNAEGKAVRKLEKPAAGRHNVVVSDLAEGFYTLRIQQNNRHQSGKLMVLR
jgi:hypothetical protein